MIPYLEDPDLTLYQGDALEVLRTLPDGSVHMCVTSPPFYGLRDYGTGSWEGGTEPEPSTCPACNADGEPCDMCGGTGQIVVPCDHRKPDSGACGKCGARRVDQQIGLEETPEQWVEKLVSVFREVRRVLRGDGSCWVEVGDSYAGSWGTQSRENGTGQESLSAGQIVAHPKQTRTGAIPAGASFKPKDLIGAPWMLAFALRADGWYLRSDIVWSRPNPMPESVTDRPTKSHSYVFLLSKSPRYFFDQEAVRERSTSEFGKGIIEAEHQKVVGEPGHETKRGHSGWMGGNGTSRNLRSVWEGTEEDACEAEVSVVVGGELVARISVPAGEAVSRLRAHGLHAASPESLARSVWQIATQPYPEAHFATYPEELVRRCILAGSSERGCCPECGAPWTREVEFDKRPRGDTFGNRDGAFDRGQAGSAYIEKVGIHTTGWRPSCTCSPSFDVLGTVPIDARPVPCTVLDPFFGSGTTGLVARKHGRRTIGIELSGAYCELAGRRLQQLSLLSGGA